MGIRTTAAFFAGAAAGWTARSYVGSTREAALTVLKYAHGVREQLMREVASQAEWLEDLLAESRARSEQAAREHPVDRSAPPEVAPPPPPPPPTATAREVA